MAASVTVIVVLGLVAYFIGNISPSTILAKKQGFNIKEEGSGNAGTTNALRTMGKKAGIITCVVDILKGVVAVIIGALIADTAGACVCGLMVYLGHVWPMIYKFKGGKGVATAFGVTLTVSPLVALISLVVTAIFVLITKRMSVGSIVGAVCMPVLVFFAAPWYTWVAIIISVIIIVKHRANIQRLMKGEEPIMSIFEKKEKGENA